MGYKECTQIQESAIPLLLEGKDVAGLSQTGTGKTAAYLLPLMERFIRSKEGETDEDNKKRQIEAWKETNFFLILVPTRELAEQVRENVKKFGSHLEIDSIAVYGGMSYEPQKRALNRGVQFVIATPGRLIDLYKEHIIDLNQVRAIVFDEADRMFDMGFKEDTKFILKRIPKDRQFVVFSATLNFDVLNVAYEFGSHPVELNISKDQAKAENVVDEVFHIGEDSKPQYLLSLLKKHEPRQAIIFSNFKNQVQRIAEFLTKNDVPAMGISSLLTQAQRNRVMAQFKSSENNRNILVATDVAARGLDVKGVDMVINYELPDDPENYVHRIGRTGRAGEKGIAFSLACDRDVDALARIEKFIEHGVTIGWMDEADLLKGFIEFPKFEHKKSWNQNGKARPGQKSHRDDRRRDKKDFKNKKPFHKRSNKNENPIAKDSHRDRITGRHQSKSSSEVKPTLKVENKTIKNSKRKTYKHRPKNERFHPDNNPLRKNVPLEKSASENKIIGFFKKLFS
ncbi:MAG: DEAD/DEAH box helicase [Bdellovibrionales bacterium]|nr:DEAD/DEAH box helicase [Bdellovibrionales bacterium]